MRKLRIDELNRIKPEEFKKAKKNGIVAVLDNVRSQNNIGSVFRTADALRIEGIYLCGISSTPPNKEIHKTALGAEDSVEWKYFEKTGDAILELREKGYTIISVEQTENSISLLDFDPQKDKRYALVFGHEIKGVDQEIVNISDASLEIPQFGTKHSFNVSVCAGIVLWEVFKKIRAI